jgi:uroporphyrinogen decarboxylase
MLHHIRVATTGLTIRTLGCILSAMTPRQRWLALLAGRKPDRIPTDYWATDEVTVRLLQELGCATREDLFCALNIDAPVKLSPGRTATAHPDDSEADEWGVRWKSVDYGAGSYLEESSHPLADATSAKDVHAFRWPSPDDFDFESFRQDLARAPEHRALQAGSYEPFMLYCSMRGRELALIDLLLAPDIVEAALDHIFRYYYELNRHIFEIGKGRIDLTYIAEDLGGQNDLLFSVPLIRRFILPNQKKMADLARSLGIHVFYHTDGAARKIIPDLIETTGIEILNPIQWRCPGMEREGLVRDFGDRVIFHGAMDNQQTLPFGTEDDVRKEVLDNIRIFSDARWICAPCHNLQPNTPTRNIVALYETIHEYGGR